MKMGKETKQRQPLDLYKWNKANLPKHISSTGFHQEWGNHHEAKGLDSFRILQYNRLLKQILQIIENPSSNVSQDKFNSLVTKAINLKSKIESSKKVSNENEPVDLTVLWTTMKSAGVTISVAFPLILAGCRGKTTVVPTNNPDVDMVNGAPINNTEDIETTTTEETETPTILEENKDAIVTAALHEGITLTPEAIVTEFTIIPDNISGKAIVYRIRNNTALVATINGSEVTVTLVPNVADIIVNDFSTDFVDRDRKIVATATITISAATIEVTSITPIVADPTEIPIAPLPAPSPVPAATAEPETPEAIAPEVEIQGNIDEFRATLVVEGKTELVEGLDVLEAYPSSMTIKNIVNGVPVVEGINPESFQFWEDNGTIYALTPDHTELHYAPFAKEWVMRDFVTNSGLIRYSRTIGSMNSAETTDTNFVGNSRSGSDTYKVALTNREILTKKFENYEPGTAKDITGIHELFDIYGWNLPDNPIVYSTDTVDGVDMSALLDQNIIITAAMIKNHTNNPTDAQLEEISSAYNNGEDIFITVQIGTTINGENTTITKTWNVQEGVDMSLDDFPFIGQETAPNTDNSVPLNPASINSFGGLTLIGTNPKPSGDTAALAMIGALNQLLFTNGIHAENTDYIDYPILAFNTSKTTILYLADKDDPTSIRTISPSFVVSP